MRSRFTFSLFALIGLLVLAAPSLGDQIYLQADFNDKTIDQPIGTGGAEVGEPIEVDTAHITAFVREDPMGSPNLEIQDASTTTAGYVVFELLGGVEVMTGVVCVAADLWFHAMTEGYSFSFLVREQGGNAVNFGDLTFASSGTVYLADEEGSVGQIGQYETGRRFRVVFLFNQDAGTYDVLLDGQLVVDDRAHGVVGRGIGRVLLGCNFDLDLNGYFNVDALSVTDYYQATPTEEDSWGRIKTRFTR